jgi:transposase
MARAYSQDLRDRVLDAALAGLPARQAAVRFGVGIATAIVRVRWARDWGAQAAPAGTAAALQARSTIQRKPDFAVCCGDLYRRRF